ncbi:hypothetical protein OG528_28100 [Streptomyces platensis]
MLPLLSLRNGVRASAAHAVNSNAASPPFTLRDSTLRDLAIRDVPLT